MAFKFMTCNSPVRMMAIICLATAVIAGCSFINDDDDDDDGSDLVSIVILQTSDLHHHAAGYGPHLDYTPLDTSDADGVLGGYARLAGLIDQIKTNAAVDDTPVLLFDSGDFFMGTIYDLTAQDPIALNFLTRMDYDAVTLGNHEFDWGDAALYNLIDAGKNAGFDIPIVASNMQTDPQNSDDDDIEALVADGTIVESRIITVADGVKVGILGILGNGAENAAPMAAPVTFNHDPAFLQSAVDAIRSEGADIVILLSHTGISEDGEGEDTDIAESVTGIDIIASGHEHTATTTAFIKGESNTIIFSPGAYGVYLSRLDITYDRNRQKITDHTFELLPVDDTVAGNEEIDEMVDGYEADINLALSELGVGLDDTVSSIGFDLEKESLRETGFGNLAADAIRRAADDLDAANSDPYAVGVIANGVIRDNIYEGSTGTVTFSDVFNALPLGISPYGDSLPGYPMMSIYLTAAEIRNLCEISASGAPIYGDDYYLNVSGIRYDYSPSNPLLQRVTDVYLSDPTDMNTEHTGTRIDLTDETTRYRLVVNLYALNMLDFAIEVGLEIIPKDENGTPVAPENYADLRIDTSAEEGIQELKEWMALEHYLRTYYPSPTGISADIYGEGGSSLGRANEVVSP